MEKKELSRLFKKAVDYLYDHHLAENQKDLASKIGVGESSLSKTKRGTYSPASSTIRKMNEAFGGIFNMDYFRGESDVMLVADLEKEGNRSVCEDQKTLLEERVAMLNERLVDKDETIASLKRELAAKEEVIATMKQQVADLRCMLVLKKRQVGCGIPDKAEDTLCV